MRILKLLLRDRVALVSALYLVCIVVACGLAALFLVQEAAAMKFGSGRLAPFDFARPVRDWLGTDQLGRSVLYMLLVAGATSLSIAICAAIIAAATGTVLGIAAGYFGGIVDTLAMRLADVILSFPSLLLAILFVYLFEPSATNIIILLVISRVPLYLRISRAETLEISRRLFVDASRMLGASNLRICRRDILPMVMPNVLTLVALDIGLLMLIESALSFLGIGIQPPSTSWGLMVASGRELMGTAWWLTFFPGLAISLTAVASSFLSNWVRIAADPAQRWRLELGQGSEGR